MEQVKKLRELLAELSDDDWIGIGEGGLTLAVQGSDWYYELGGLRAEDDAAQDRVVLMDDDRDPHGAGCTCGLCNRNGISYAVGVYAAADPTGDVLERFYAPSSEAAWVNAKLWALQSGYLVVAADEV